MYTTSTVLHGIRCILRNHTENSDVYVCTYLHTHRKFHVYVCTCLHIHTLKDAQKLQLRTLYDTITLTCVRMHARTLKRCTKLQLSTLHDTSTLNCVCMHTGTHTLKRCTKLQLSTLHDIIITKNNNSQDGSLRSRNIKIYTY